MTQQSGQVSRPVPEPDEESMPFFDGAAEGKLMIKQCGACGVHLDPVRVICTECLAENPEWVQASGDATLFTYAIMHQRYHPGFDPYLPYNVAVVELEEGPRLNTNLVDIANEDIKVGMKVKVTFEVQGVHDGKEVYLPKFRPA